MHHRGQQARAGHQIANRHHCMMSRMNTGDDDAGVDRSESQPVEARPDADEEAADDLSGDGERVSSAERRRRADAEKELSLRGHTGSVECLCFFTTTRGTLRLASGSLDCSIKIWNPLSRTDGPINSLVRTQHLPHSHRISHSSYQTPQNKTMAWQVGHTAPVMCIDTSRDHTQEPRLASGSEDGSVRALFFWWRCGSRCGLVRLTLRRSPCCAR